VTITIDESLLGENGSPGLFAEIEVVLLMPRPADGDRNGRAREYNPSLAETLGLTRAESRSYLPDADWSVK